VCAEPLNRAATGGESDFAALLANVGSDHTTRTIPAVDPRSFRRRARRSKPLPTDHVEGHGALLSPRAGRRMLAVVDAHAGQIAAAGSIAGLRTALAA